VYGIGSESERRLRMDTREAIEGYQRLFPMGVGMDLQGVKPGSEVNGMPFLYGGFLMRLTVFKDGAPTTKAVRMPMKKGDHPAKVLAGLLKQAEKEFRLVARTTQVEKGSEVGAPIPLKDHGLVMAGRACGKDL
jgi:hypothetical protein